VHQGFYFTSFGDLSVDEEDGQQEQWQYPRHVCHLMALPQKRWRAAGWSFINFTVYIRLYRSIDCWCCSWRCPIEYLRQKADQSAGTVITDALCHQGNHTPNNKKLLKSAQVHTDSFFSINFFNPPSDFPFKLKQNRPLFHYRHWNVSKRHQLKSNR
jgi:hypothetical protein